MSPLWLAVHDRAAGQVSGDGMARGPGAAPAARAQSTPSNLARTSAAVLVGKRDPVRVRTQTSAGPCGGVRGELGRSGPGQSRNPYPVRPSRVDLERAVALGSGARALQSRGALALGRNRGQYADRETSRLSLRARLLLQLTFRTQDRSRSLIFHSK
jgi:hypothetical protein